MRRLPVFLMMAAALAASATRAHAHGAFNMLLGSTLASGGTLKLDYEFTSVSTLSLSGSTGMPGGDAVFTGIEPSITLLKTNDLATPSYVLDSGTDVTLVITAIDDGVKVQIVNDDTTTTCTSGSPCNLEAVADSAKLGVVGTGNTLDPAAADPHIHPTYSLQLKLDGSAQVQYGEGRVSFKLTTTSGTYTQSPIYTIKLSNGPLPHFDYDTAAYDSKKVICQQMVGLQVHAFISHKLSYLRVCLDRVQVYKARSVAILSSIPKIAAKQAKALAASQISAEKACANASGTSSDSKTLLGQIAAAYDHAFASIQVKCGTPGATTVTGKTIPSTAAAYLTDDNAIRQLLGVAGCRAEEEAAAAYGGALDDLEAYTARPSQGGQTLDAYFPCLYSTAAE